MNREEVFSFISRSETLSFLDEEARDVLGRLFDARPQYRKLLAEQACRDLHRAYRARIDLLYLNPAIEKIFRNARKIDLYSVADIDRVDGDVLRRAEAATAAELGDDPAAVFRTEMPVLAEIGERIRENYLRSTVEMLDNIVRYSGMISDRLFGGKSIRTVTSFTGMSGDVHRHGRAVAGVRTDAGTFYYKPHDCRLDGMYHDLIGELFSDCTVAADCVPGDDCGFAEELIRAPLAGPGELPAYYRRFGILLALFYSIGGNDMHCDNFLPCGAMPAAVDLETLFKPRVRDTERPGARWLRTCPAVRRELRHTVRNTSILPSYQFEVGMTSPLYHYGEEDLYLPFIGDRQYTVRGFEDDFIRGFAEGCRRVAGNREKIRELFSAYKDAPIRFLVRPTAYYDTMRRMLFMEKNLVSGEARDTLLRRLEVPYRHAGIPADGPVVDYEAAGLREGDVPYFCVSFSGKDLCGEDTNEVIRRDYFSRDAREMCLEYLDAVSEKDILTQTDIIRCCLSQVAEKEEKDGQPRPLGSDPPSGERIRAVLAGILDRIDAGEIRLSDGTVVWQSILHILYHRIPCGFELFTASAGLFSTVLNRADPGNGNAERIRTNAREFLSRAFSEALGQDDSRGLTTELGFEFGFASVMTCCDLMAACGDSKAEATFDSLVRLLLEKELYITRDARGLCDLTASLCMAGTVSPAKEKLAARCRETLAGILPPKGKMTAVMLAQCALAAACSGETAGGDPGRTPEAYLDSLRSLYSGGKAGWPDEEAFMPWLAPRGPQAAWITLCMLRILKAGVSEETRGRAGEILRLALESLMSERELRHNDSLYHGNALVAAALTAAAEQTGDRRYLDRAGSVLTAMMDRAEQKGTFTVCPEGVRSFFDVSFVRGTPGIGCAAAYYLLTRRN